MIITSETQTIERSNNVECENTFRIKASAHAFRILSDGLYSDKIGSIIRELSCNAVDATIAVKSNDAFIVHLPNTLEPFFAVRDFGTGLSHEDVMTIYTTYFESSKTSSNEFTGCMGLGSKSAFSYTDAFTVTSWFNGAKNTYNMFINESGVPSVALLSSIATTESNGLEVMFAVKQIDNNQFGNSAKKLYPYFKIQPKITGQQLVINPIKYTMEKTGWGLGDEYGRAKAIMGNVCYPLDDCNIEGLTTSEQSLLRVNITLFFNIGELDVSASREKLSYNSQTKKNIRTKLTAVLDEMMKEVQIKIDACKSLWDVRTLLYQLNNTECSALMDTINKSTLMWQGQLVHDYRNGLMATDINTTTIKDKVVVTLAEINYSHRRDGYKVSFEHRTNIPVSDSIVFMVKDDSKHIKLRMIDWHKLRKIEHEKIHGSNYNYTSRVWLIEETIAGGIDTFKSLLGMDTSAVFSIVSGLPYTVVPRVSGVSGVSGGYNAKNACSVLRFNDTITGDREVTDFWKQEKIDKSLGGVYVIIDRYFIGGQKPKNFFTQYFTLFKELNIDIPVIYGVKTRETDTFTGMSNWIPFKQYAINAISKKLEDPVFKKSLESANYIAILNSYRDSNYSERNLVDNIIAHGENVFTNNELITTIKCIKAAEQYKSFNDKISNIALHTGYKFNNTVDTLEVKLNDTFLQRLKSSVEVVRNTYPLFEKMERYSFDVDTVNHLKHYVKLIDNSIQKSEIGV